MERFCAMCGDPTRQQQHFCVSCLVPPVPTLVPLPDLVPSPTPPLDSISRLSPSPSLWKAQTTVPETLTTTPLPHCPQLDTYCSLIERDLNIYGFSVIDNFLPAGDPILTEVVQLYATGHFTAGQVANRKSSPSGIRGDQVVWVKGTEANCTAIGQLMSMFDAIIGRCNARAKGEFGRYQISGRTKAMVACYPGNYAKYVRHVDNPNGDGRCVTCIYYLNKNYVREKHGGVLRIFPEQSDGIVADIEPHFNRAIFFWSDRRNPHEVMPATRLRFAITVWYIDALQRRRKSVEQMGKCATT